MDTLPDFEHTPLAPPKIKREPYAEFFDSTIMQYWPGGLKRADGRVCFVTTWSKYNGTPTGQFLLKTK